MKTINTKLLNREENRKYYSELDTPYMPLEAALNCPNSIPRLGWARNWIHELGCRTMLDIGGIDGFFSTAMQAEGLDCVNIEPMKTAVEWGRRIAEESGYDVKHILGFYEDESVQEELLAVSKDLGLDIKLKNGDATPQFDAIACMETLEHVLDPDHFLKWACKRGKYLTFSTPDAFGRFGLTDAVYNPGHIRLYTEQELRDQLTPYGEILELKKENDILLAIVKVK